jgi:hypothetical protein
MLALRSTILAHESRRLAIFVDFVEVTHEALVPVIIIEVFDEVLIFILRVGWWRPNNFYRSFTILSSSKH